MFNPHQRFFQLLWCWLWRFSTADFSGLCRKISVRTHCTVSHYLLLLLNSQKLR